MPIFWCCHTLLSHLPLFISRGSVVSWCTVKEIGHLDPIAVQSSPIAVINYQAAAIRLQPFKQSEIIGEQVVAVVRCAFFSLYLVRRV